MSIIKKPWGSVKPPLGARHNQSHPLSVGLIAHWMMNEKGGATLYDYFRSRENLAINGATWANGTFGSALQFNGSSNWASRSTGSDNSITMGVKDWSVALRFKRNVTTSGIGEGFIGCWNANDYWYFSKWDTNTLRFRMNDTGIGALNVDGSASNLDTDWHHAVISIKRNATGQMYRDGKTDGSAVSVTTYDGVSIDQGSGVEFDLGAIGSHADFSSYFNGILDDIRIYNRALTAQEVAWLYAEPFADMMPMTFTFGKNAATFKPFWGQRATHIIGGAF